MSIDFKAVIPARYGSSRFPAKVLADIHGKPMIQHVYERALQSGAGEVVLATDDERVAQAATAFGADVCMTAIDHQSGSDRIAEVTKLRRWPAEAIVVNVQGDEPLIPPVNIRQAAECLAAAPDAFVATLVTPFTAADNPQDSNNVKVVTDKNGYALYFSRSVIPHRRDAGDTVYYQRHVGLYAYRVRDLQQFVQLAPAPLEQIEKLEQLRVLWHGLRIVVAQAQQPPPPGVDTAQDLQRLLALPR